MHDGSEAGPPSGGFRASDSLSSPNDLTRLGEYRPITILFADLVGSTLITQGYDREELRDIIKKFRGVVRPIVEEWGGSNPRSFGDALMFSFGHPRTHEDDPERAVRAALKVHEALEAFGQEDGIVYQAHIGIATDMILVGDEQDREDLRADEFFGDGPILASKLQSDAAPGETVICEATQDRVSDLFRCEKMIGRTYKNFGAPIDVYRVLGEVDAAAHLKRINRPADTGFVGRHAELTRLMTLWEKARTGDCQIVNVSGEAGIGKSRLLKAQRRHLALGKHVGVLYKCLRHHEKTPYYPFLTQMELWAAIRGGDDTATRVAKLRGVLGDVLAPRQMEILIALMVPDAASARLLAEMPVDAFQAHLLDIYVAIFTALVEDAPALLHFEDVHWMDASSRRLLTDAVERLRDLPVMIVTSRRPEAPAFLSGDNVLDLELRRMGDGEVRDLVRALPDAAELEPHALDRIIEVTNGVPLFVEHYTASVLRGKVPGPGEPAQVPEQIFGLLFEQIDGTGPDRGIALAATAIGRPFDARLLAAASGMPVDETQAVIARLLERGMLIEARSSSELPYRFSHVLVQDAGYNSMVRKHRKILHERIAQHLLEDRPDLADRAPELLARQFREAGLNDQAIRMSLRAGELAASRFANAEAIQHAEAGRSLLSKASEPARAKLAMKLNMLLAVANSAEQGFGSAATLDGFEQAYALASEIGDYRVLLRAAQGLFAAYHAHANYVGAGEIGDEIHRKIAETGDALNTGHARAIADRIIGGSLIWRGEFEQAHRVLSRALEHTGRTPDGRHKAAAHQTIASLALAEAYLGNTEAAVRLAGEAIDAAKTGSTPMSVGNAMLMACNVHQIIRHPDAEAHAKALEAYAREQNMPFYIEGARSFVGVALYQDPDRVAEGFAMLEDAWPKFQETAARANQVFVCVERAEGLRQMVEPERALAYINEGIQLSETYHEHNFDAELLRLKAVLMLELGDNSEEPVELLGDAVKRAADQGAKLFELRALTELAPLVQSAQADPAYLDRLEAALGAFGVAEKSVDVRAARDALSTARSQV